MTVKPVHEEPEVTLFAWHFMQENWGDYRLVGYRTDNSCGRITSAIIEFDMAARTATTASGRVYRLQGEPDLNRAARVVHRHISAHGLPISSVAMVDPEDVALACARPSAHGLN